MARDLTPRGGVGQSERNGTVHVMENVDLPLVAELVVPADTDMLTVCRTVLAGIGIGIPLSDEALDDLKLVLSEICAAAMERSAGADATVDIAFRCSDREIAISVSDQGADGPAEEQGLGLPLLRQLCTRLDVAPRTGGPGRIVRFAQLLPA
ncbi:MAG TPA: ATP-binding protein [Gaiellales bacterium]